MSNICIVVLIGIPGTGKTHLCKYITENVSSTDIKVTTISYDEFASKQERTIYKDLRNDVYNMVDNLIENKSDDFKEWLILIDDNMYYRSMRRSYYGLAKKYSTGYCQIYVVCTIETAISRNNSRTVNFIPTDVITAMAEKLEPPSNNNTWENNSIEINSEEQYTNNEKIKEIKKLIAKAMQSPVQSEQKITHDQPFSYIHNADLILRKIVKSKLKIFIESGGNKKNLENLSKQLVIKKRQILHDLRNNVIFLPDENDTQSEVILSKMMN